MNTNSITTTDSYISLKDLLGLIDECHARGVLQLKLPSGVEFVLNAAHVPRSSLPKSETPDKIIAGPAPLRPSLNDEIDAELFGEPLKNPTE